MLQKSMWWLCLLSFGFTIGGIHSLGWWTQPANAQAKAGHSTSGPNSTIAAQRHMQCLPHHWRAMIMQQ